MSKYDNCRFIVHGSNGRLMTFTKLQLASVIAFNNINSIDDLDIIFQLKDGSASFDSTIKILEKLNSRKPIVPEFIGDEFGSSESDVITASNYIDSESFLTIFPHKVVRAGMNKDEYKAIVKSNFIRIDGLSEEEAESLIEATMAYWENIKEVGTLLHVIFTDSVRGNITSSNIKFSEYLLKNFNDLYNKIKNLYSTNGDSLINNLAETVRSINQMINVLMLGIRATEKTASGEIVKDSEGKTKYKKNSVYNHLNFIGLMQDGTKIMSHVDKLFVDNDGNIHIFNFKVSATDSNRWGTNKKLKYAYENAILIKILELYNFDSTKINIYDVPMVVSYDSDKSQIVGFLLDSKRFINFFEKDLNSSTYGSKYIDKIKSLFAEYNPEKALITHNDLNNSRIFIKNLIPSLDATEQGLKKSAIAYIRENINKTIIEDKIKGGYIILYKDGKQLYIKSNEPPLSNQELIDAIQIKFKTEHEGEKSLAYLIYLEIKANWALSSPFENKSSIGLNAAFKQQHLGKYLLKDPITGDHNWALVDNEELLSCNILLFKKLTGDNAGLIDVVVPTGFNLDETIDFDYKSHTTILGYHLNNAKTNIKFKNNYGDFELLRAAAVINDVLLKLGNIKFGEIQVLSANYGGRCKSLSMKTCVEQFNIAQSYLNTLPEIKLTNNYNKGVFLEKDELIIAAWNNFINEPDIPSYIKNNIVHRINIDGFLDLESLEAKVQKALEILESIEKIIINRDLLPGEKVPISTIVNYSKSSDPKHLALSLIYIKCAEFINSFNKWEYPDISKITKFDRAVLPQYVNPDSNVRLLAGMYRKALDNTALRFQLEYGPMRDEILKTYDLTGNNNTLLSDPEGFYEEFYEKDSNNKKTWRLLNPYDNSNPLVRNINPEKLKLLKKILFSINKIRSNRTNPGIFTFKSENDLDFINYINEHPECLNVPLLKGSTAHLRRNMGAKYKKVAHELEEWSNLGTRKYLQKKKEESLRNYNDDEDVTMMSVQNPYDNQESTNGRVSQINLFGDEYFETNLEYILADYTEAAIISEELDKVNKFARTMLFTLELLLGDQSVHGQKCILETIDALKDYMKLNIFGKSIMTSFGLQYTAMMDPTRRLMTNIFIMGNIRSAVRDIGEGLWLNFARVITQYGTDLKSDSIIEGYKTVMQKCMTSDRDLNVISELCLRYRLSNVDAAKIAERAKTGKGGLLNPEKYGYSTLRGPDFLNRMTLFVARCKQDGTWDAFSLDLNRTLHYNWKKDKRFEIYAKGKDGDKTALSDTKYKEQEALYYYYIQQWNQEHPDNTLKFTDDLIEPYSRLEIDNFKEFSDGIYGAYDKSQKSMYEHWAIGQSLGVFTTWMNAHTAAWLKVPGHYNSKFSLKDENGNFRIKKDSFNGNELYFDTSNNGNIVEKTSEGKFINDKGEEVDGSKCVPCYEAQDVYSLGIWYTLKDSFEVITKNGFDKESFIKEVWSNPYDRENIYKFSYDLLMFSILSALFGFVLTPAYKDYKKSADVDNALQNALVELLYKSGSTSYDGFAGPYAALDYIFNDVKPLAPSTSLKLIGDLWKAMVGEKTWMNIVYSNAPIFRAFKDTAKISNPDTFKKPNT